MITRHCFRHHICCFYCSHWSNQYSSICMPIGHIESKSDNTNGYLYQLFCTCFIFWLIEFSLTAIAQSMELIMDKFLCIFFFEYSLSIRVAYDYLYSLRIEQSIKKQFHPIIASRMRNSIRQILSKLLSLNAPILHS